MRTLDGGDGTWSFYRLQAKAIMDTSGIATWSIPVTTGGPAVQVRFAIRGTAWAPFQLSTTGS